MVRYREINREEGRENERDRGRQNERDTGYHQGYTWPYNMIQASVARYYVLM